MINKKENPMTFVSNSSYYALIPTFGFILFNTNSFINWLKLIFFIFLYQDIDFI